jgi:site-specific recombinase
VAQSILAWIALPASAGHFAAFCQTATAKPADTEADLAHCLENLMTLAHCHQLPKTLVAVFARTTCFRGDSSVEPHDWPGYW